MQDSVLLLLFCHVTCRMFVVLLVIYLLNHSAMQVLTATFKTTGTQACELWKHDIMGVIYAIAPNTCPPINCTFIGNDTVTI